MALTLTEGEKYSRTELQKGFIDLLVKDSTILQRLPFQSILGNSLTYNRVTTRSGAKFYSVGDTWVESVPTLTQDTAKLTILGGDADVDNFLQKTHSNINDIKAQVLADKALAVREEYMDTFWYGSGTAPEFKGLHKLIADSSTYYNTVIADSGDTEAVVLSLGSHLDLAIDYIHGFKPDGIWMTKAMRRLMKTYLDSVGAAYPAERDAYGRMVRMYADLPVYVDEHLLGTELTSSGVYSASTGGNTCSIFVLSFGPTQVCGIQGPDSVEVVPLGDLETKDATRTRVRWYCSLMFQNLRSAAKVVGIDADGAVAK